MKKFYFVVIVLMAMTAADETPNLTFSLESTVNPILGHEPLPMKFVLRNDGDTAIETTLGLSRIGFELLVNVSSPSGKKIRWFPGWEVAGSVKPLIRERLRAKSSSDSYLDCSWQNNYPVFDEIGKYRVVVTWSGSLGPAGTPAFLSDVAGTPIEREAILEITVVEGTETDKKCLEYMLAHQIQGYLSLDAKEFLFVDTKTMSTRKTEKEKIETLESLLHVAKNFQDSRYSIYALATLLSVVEDKSVTDDLRKKILALAEEHISKKTSPRQAPHMPHPRVLYTYALYLAKESPARALTLLEQAKTLKPDFVAGDRIEKLAAQIAWEQKTKNWTPEDFLKYREAQEAEKKRKEEEEARKQKTK